MLTFRTLKWKEGIPSLSRRSIIESNSFRVGDEFNAPVMSKSKKGDYRVFLPSLEKRYTGYIKLYAQGRREPKKVEKWHWYRFQIIKIIEGKSGDPTLFVKPIRVLTREEDKSFNYETKDISAPVVEEGKEYEIEVTFFRESEREKRPGFFISGLTDITFIITKSAMGSIKKIKKYHHYRVILDRIEENFYGRKFGFVTALEEVKEGKETGQQRHFIPSED